MSEIEEVRRHNAVVGVQIGGIWLLAVVSQAAVGPPQLLCPRHDPTSKVKT